MRGKATETVKNETNIVSTATAPHCVIKVTLQVNVRS